ncbi:MAG: formate dehydrogenase accessory sulfurtransferase FdhD [Armatimonadetes bacterium]|nr:formate dehydrogenase accessory sulfurtransferase FdhD [Armatimonadota bacterium]
MNQEASKERPGSAVRLTVAAVENGAVETRCDDLTTEEPMEIRVIAGPKELCHRIAVTMRTPGHDFELAAGFLLAEGVIRDRRAIRSISYCTDPGEPQHYNIVNVRLAPGVPFDASRLSRNVFTASSCGICGKNALEQVQALCAEPPVGAFRLPADYWLALPDLLRRAQSLFARTGGLHATALFDTEGCLLLLREDIGRHNAFDKLNGSLLLAGRLPASETVAVVSGRASFELVQKALIAGIPALASVGAPSSLAADLARAHGMTLIGFLRESRFNIYCGTERVEV